MTATFDLTRVQIAFDATSGITIVIPPGAAPAPVPVPPPPAPVPVPVPVPVPPPAPVKHPNIIPLLVDPGDGTPPSIPGDWVGPRVAVNPPKPGQVATLTVDGVKVSDFGFLSRTISDGKGGLYPLLADGGRVIVTAPWVNADHNYAAAADFPGGITVQGNTPSGTKPVIWNFNPPMGKGVTLWQCSVQLVDLEFRAGSWDGTTYHRAGDESSGGYGGVRFDNGGNGSAVAHHAHLLRCKFNDNEMGIFSAPGNTLNGENWTIVADFCDFGDVFPCGLNSDELSHCIYTGATTVVRNSHFYDPGYGACLKGRCRQFISVNNWIRRGSSHIIDYPDGGDFWSYGDTLLSQPQPSSGESGKELTEPGESDLNLMSFHNDTGGIFGPTNNPKFYDTTLWVSRRQVQGIANASGSGEMFLVGDMQHFLTDGSVKIEFHRPTVKWSNENGYTPGLVCVPGSCTSGLGVSDSTGRLDPPAGTVFEKMPAAPPLASTLPAQVLAAAA